MERNPPEAASSPVTADGRDEGAASPDLEELDEVDGCRGRAVIVPSSPRRSSSRVPLRLGRPGWVVADSLDSGLAFFVGAPEDARAVAIVCSGDRSAPPAVVLWLDDQGASADRERAGVVVFHRRKVLMWHQWHGEDAGSLVGEAADLAEAVGRPGDQVGVRALLRRRDLPAVELLGDLVALTGMPQQAFALLTTEARPPDAEVLVAQPGAGHVRNRVGTRGEPCPSPAGWPLSGAGDGFSRPHCGCTSRCGRCWLLRRGSAARAMTSEARCSRRSRGAQLCFGAGAGAAPGGDVSLDLMTARPLLCGGR